LANDSSQTEPLETLTAQEIQATFSPTHQDMADPTQTLKDLEARMEIEKIQVQQVADLIPILKKLFTDEIQKLEAVIKAFDKLIEEQQMLNELQAEVAKRNILWAKAVQGQFVMKEYPITDQKTSTVSAERKPPSAASRT